MLKRTVFALAILFPLFAFASTTAVPWQTVIGTNFIYPALVNGTQQGTLISASSTIGGGVGLTIFGNATTTGTASSSNSVISSLLTLSATPNAVLGTNGSGQVQATTSIGTNYITGVLGTINSTSFSRGGTITVTAASSSILGDNNTFSGTDIFNNTISGSISGNAGTATALQNARTINGVSFNGTANIVVASTTLLGDNNTFGGNNIFSASTTFSNIINVRQASTSLETLGTLWITGLSQVPLYVNSSGQVVSGGTGTSGHCIQWGANNTFADAGAACGTSSGGITALGNYATTTGATISFSTTTETTNGVTLGVTAAVSNNAILFTPTISGTLTNAGLANSSITINGTGVSLGNSITVSSTTLLASDNNTFSGNTTFVASTTFQKQINAQGASTTLLSAVTGWIGTLNLTNPLTVANGGTGLTSTSQNFFFAGPTSGSGAPTWRAIVAGDIPTLNQNTSGSAGSVANSLSNDGATLTGSSFNGSSAVSNWAINLTHPNSWTGLQNFTGNASSSIFSVNVGPLYVGGVTATTTITANATSTFATGLNLTTGCVTYQGGLCLGAAGTFIGGTSLAVQLATTGALPANTYAGGVLTEVGTGALTVDGTGAAVGNRILVKNEVAQTNNGIYSVTAAGSGIAAYVLTRVSDYNSSANVYPGEATYVIGGATLDDDWWALTTVAPITVGGGGSGSNLTYVETSAAGSGVVSVSCPGGFLTCSGTNPASFSIGTLPIANGGTATTSVTTYPWASSWAGWDSNLNLSANNFLAGFLNVSTGGTTVLSAASAYNVYVTAATPSTIKLPAITSIPAGTTYKITNEGFGGTVSIQDSAGNPLFSMADNFISFPVFFTNMGAAGWDVEALNVQAIGGADVIFSGSYLLQGNSGATVTVPGSGGQSTTLAASNFGQTFSGIQNFSGNIGIASSTPWSALSIGSGSISIAEASSTPSTTFYDNWKSSNQNKIELTGNVTIDENNNVIAGASHRLIVCQPVGGGDTITWGSASTTINWAAGTTPTQTSTGGQCDIYSFVVTGATGTVTTFGAQTANF